MASTPQKLVEDVLSLNVDERRDIFLKLAETLPIEVEHLAESYRRAEEMRKGIVAPMDAMTFEGKLRQLKSTLRHA